MARDVLEDGPDVLGECPALLQTRGNRDKVGAYAVLLGGGAVRLSVENTHGCCRGRG